MLKFILGSHVNAGLVFSSACITASQETKIGLRRRLSSRYVFTMRIVRRLGMLTFLQDKDISKYNQALAQVLDGISAKAAFIKVRKNCRVLPVYCGSHIHSSHKSAQPRMSSPGWRLGSPSGSSISRL